jgi:hypothetical protein
MTKFASYWPQRKNLCHRYADSIYEPPFSFERFYNLKGVNTNFFEYDNGLLFYTGQKVIYYKDGEKIWETKPLKPAKEFNHKEYAVPIIIDDLMLYPCRQWLVCFDLKNNGVLLWQIKEPSIKEFDKKFNTNYSGEFWDGSFFQAIYYNDNFIFYSADSGPIIKIDYKKGEFLKVLDVFANQMSLSTGNRLMGRTGERKKAIDYFTVYNFETEQVEYTSNNKIFIDLHLGSKSFADDKYLFVVDGANKYCFSIGGEYPLIWKKELGEFLCADKTNIYFYESEKKAIRSALISTGEIVWETDGKGLRLHTSSERIFVDNKYLHGTLSGYNHVTIDKKNGDIVFAGRIYDGRCKAELNMMKKYPILLDKKDGEFELDLELDLRSMRYFETSCIYNISNITPGKSKIYYNTINENEFLCLKPSNHEKLFLENNQNEN